MRFIMRILLLPGTTRQTICALAFTCAAIAALTSADGRRRAGDTLSHLLPAGVLVAELRRSELGGLAQFGLSFVTTVGAVEGIKRMTHVERADLTNDQSLPGRHAARAFAAGAFVQRRHRVESALALYALAACAGHGWVEGHRRRWSDTAGAAAAFAASTIAFVKPGPVTDSAGHRPVVIQRSAPLR
jgi:hypothetical protein